MNALRRLAALTLALAPAAAFAQASPSPYTSGTRYDGAGRVTGTIVADPDGPGSWLPFPAVRNTYDAAGRLTLVESGSLANWQSDSVAPASWSGFTPAHTLETTYDAMGRKAREMMHEGGPTGTVRSLTQYHYDLAGRLDCTAVRMNENQFAASLPDACTQAGGTVPDRITRTIYDAAGQRVQLRQGVGTSDEGTEATWVYNGNGQVTFVIDGNGNRAQLHYDGQGRQDCWIFPSRTGPTQFDDSTPDPLLDHAGDVSGDCVTTGDYERYGYDPNGNRTSLRKRDGSILNYTFDPLNRVTLKSISTSRSDLTTAQIRPVYYAYDLHGLQLSARFDSQTGEGITHVYDGFGRLVSSSTNMGGTTRTLTYQYDANGNRTRITHPDSAFFTYNYDMTNRPTLVRESGANWLNGFSYTAAGPLDSQSYGATLFTLYGYDGLGRMNVMYHILPVTAMNVQSTYARNPAGELASVTRSNDAYAWTGHYAVNRAYTTNGLNQYTAAGGASFGYDANGNLVSDGSRTYLYDVENRLVGSSNGAALVYDPLGRLFQVTGPQPGGGTATTQFLYDGDALVAEYNGSGTLQHRYVHGVGTDIPEAVYDSASLTTPRFLIPDERGSIIALSDVGGAAIALNTYDEYGIPGTANQGRFQYTGQAWLPELGMYYYKARMYSPTLGRFMQTDPIGYRDQFNLYEYVGDDPVDRADPTGLYVCGGDKEQCSAAERAINDVRIASRNTELSRNERQSLSQIASFYGRQGERNGTVVIFKPTEEIMAATRDRSANATTIQIPRAGLVAVVLPNNFSRLLNDFPSSVTARGRDLSHFSPRAERAGMVAHEGKHGFDMRNGIPHREPPAYSAGRAVERSMGAIPANELPSENER